MSRAVVALKVIEPSRGRRQRSPQAAALAWVRQKSCPPQADAGTQGPIRIADFFCGCGGLTLGAVEAARLSGRPVDVRMAVDFDADAAAVYRANFPTAATSVFQRDMAAVFDGQNGAVSTTAENAVRERCGPVDAILAGPPCQGHSDLNNSTRRDDPRNLLYLRATRAVEVLRPRSALIENVPSVIHDKAGVVGETAAVLERIGYKVTSAVFDVRTLGLPQRRRRHVLLATTTDLSIAELVPQSPPPRVPLGPFLAGLEDEPETSTALLAKPAKMTVENARRVKYLFDNDAYDLPDESRPPCHRDKEHTYQSVYGRLRWDAPAQTITSGFGSMGQGRFIHPRRPRLITPHEAARIQGFPDFFDFSAASGLTALRTMIGNAVPPPLMIELFGAILKKGGI